MGQIMRTQIKYLVFLSSVAMSLSLNAQSSVSKDITLQPGKVSDRDISSVSGDIKIGKNARVAGSVSTVSGDIEVAVGSRLGNVNTVSGDVLLGKKVHTKDIETVSGDIHLYESCQVKGSIETVSGDIVGNGGCDIQDGISSVSGDIEVDDTRIRGDIKTVSGDISLFNGSVVDGDIIVNRTNDFFSGPQGKMKIVIDMNSVVKGSIRVKEKDTNVIVYLSNGGKVRGEIINAEVREL